MRPPFAAVCTLMLALILLAAPSAQTQTAGPEAKTAGKMEYDVSQEVTINGTVATVLTTALPGTVMGSHLLLTTVSGSVDVSLGNFGLSGKDAFSVAVGQQIEVIGVMRMFRNKPVFLARVVKLGDSVYAIRNEYGIPITPYSRLRASQNSHSGERQ